VQQLGHQVVGGVQEAPVDVVGEVALEHVAVDIGHRLSIGHLVARLQLEAVVDAGADEIEVAVGHAHQLAHQLAGHLRPEVAHEVEPGLADELVERVGTELADLRFECEHLLGGEHPGEQAAVHVVGGRILEDHHALGQLGAALDHLEQRAFAGDEPAEVLEAGLDIVEAAEGKEVIAFVVVERRLIAHALPQRIRVLVDLEVERVVVDLGALPHGRDGNTIRKL